MAGEKLIRIMRDAGRTPQSKTTDLLFGVVTAISQLKIKVDNRFEVTADHLLLSALVKEKKVNIDGSSVTLWRGLQVGDTVRLLRVNEGQMFYVLERGTL